MTDSLDRSDTGRASTGWPAVLALLAAASASLAVCLYTLDHLKYRVIAAVVAHQALRPGRIFAGLGPLDFLVAAFAAGAALLLVVMEWRRRSFSRLLANGTPAQCLATLTIFTAWTGQAYLYPGVLLGGDSGEHIVRFLELGRGFAQGELAQWSNYDYLGSALLTFTGPLFYVVGGFTAFLVNDAVVAAKIIMLVSHMLSGWLFYAWVRRIGIERTTAMIAALGFAGAFAHLHLFLDRGVFPQGLTIVFMLVLFYTAEGLGKGGRRVPLDWALFALATGGLISNHQPHAVFVAVYLALFGGMSCLLGRWQWSVIWRI